MQEDDLICVGIILFFELLSILITDYLKTVACLRLQILFKCQYILDIKILCKYKLYHCIYFICLCKLYLWRPFTTVLQ